MACTIVLLTCVFFVTSVTSVPRRQIGTKISEFSNYLEGPSYIGKEISCTEEEKTCYRHGRVLFSDGKCYKFASPLGPCAQGYQLYFDKTLAAQGVYCAVCTKVNPCADVRETLMAYDQTCYLQTLLNYVCEASRNLTLTKNLFNEGHCQAVGNNSTILNVSQPDEVGKCRLPFLMYKETKRTSAYLYRRQFACSNKEHECFMKGKVLFEDDGRCYDLLSKGPCPDGEIIVLNKELFFSHGWLLSTCKQSCPQNQIKMYSDSQCYDEEYINTKICPPLLLTRNVFGEGECSYGNATLMNFLPKAVNYYQECYL